MIINFVDKNNGKTIVTPIIVQEAKYESEQPSNYKVGDYIHIPKEKYKRLISDTETSVIKEIKSTGFYRIIGICYDSTINEDCRIELRKSPTIYVEEATPPWC